MNKTFLKKMLAATIFVGTINFLPVNFSTENLQIISVAHAEVKDVTAKDAAILDFADESPTLTAQVQNVAKMRAIERAKERAGVFIQSFSRTVNGVLTADDISAFTTNNIKVEDVKYQKLFYQVKDASGNLTGKVGFMYEATVTAKIDTAGLFDYIQKSTQEKQALIDRDKSQQKNVADVNSQYEALRKNADKKTPAQINAELEQINQKISGQNKQVEQKNSPIIFSQPQKIGEILLDFGRVGGYEINGATSNNGNYYRKVDKNNSRTFESGTATFGNGENSIYCQYGNGDLKFSGKDFSKQISVSTEGGGFIYQIDTNKKLVLYLIGHGLVSGNYAFIGKRQDGTFAKYLITEEISKKFFGTDRIFYDSLTCENDVIKIKYSSLDNKTIKGEFRFKWDEVAQWFSIEKIAY